MGKASNWITVTESRYPWERDALDFVRQKFPSHEPYRAWSGFEFIADDGSINEVDLLAFSPQGFFLVEIKSWPGRLSGDAGTWTWEADGKPRTVDNPLIAANLKAKKLRSLLQRQKVCQKKGQLPFIEALVFCSAPDLHCELQGNARFRVCLRDRDAASDKPARPGILAAITRRECAGLDPSPKGTHDRPMAKLVGQAMEQAGIRPSQRHRKVSDYVLEQLVGEGPGYQDWQATHVQVAESKRRVRLYLVRTGATAEDRQMIERAGLREFQILEMLQHPGILRVHGFTEHEVGPALLFEHDPLSIRLDHFLAQQKDKLSINSRLDLMRQIAEVIRYAHDKKVIHRALCPQSILVVGADSGRPRIKIFNWQVGCREGTSSSGVSRGVSATSHVDRLVEDASTAYMAPEALTDEHTGEHLDVFSLGAIAYHVFSGVPPASNGLELSNKLRETTGLQISAVLNGAGEWLQMLIQEATHPIVGNRADSVVDFLSVLDEVERERTAPEHEYVDDPTRAQIDDLLPGGYRVVRRLGQGACSVALLVERDGQDFVVKVANDLEHNARIKDEADVLSKLRHAHVVELVEALEMGDRAALVMWPVFADKDKKVIETLGHRLRKEGRLHIDLLQRFGEDLLDVVNHLEEQGIPHRDIKPDNIAVGMVGRGNRLHLVLFDFSLSRMPPDNIRAGTTGYLDPLLPLRKPPRWDLHAERYAAAMTLYELATGTLPKWGDGATDPSHLSVDTEITIDAELFDAGLRDRLTEFFGRAFRRNPEERFDNGEEMLREWRDCFEGIEQPGSLSDHADEPTLRLRLAEAAFETPISELGLGTRAANALDRQNMLTVEDLLSVSPWRLQRLRGVGKKTAREILLAARILRQRLGKPRRGAVPKPSHDAAEEATPQDVASLSVDQLMAMVVKSSPDARTDKDQTALRTLLGLDLEWDESWPSQTEVARQLGVTPLAVHNALKKAIQRWSKQPAVTRLRDDLVEIVVSHGGVVGVDELGTALLAARGCTQDEPLRSRWAQAVARAATEVERTRSEPRLVVRRDHDRTLVAVSVERAVYAFRLGQLADELADVDPLVTPARVIERLREVPAPSGEAIADKRLVRMAAVASQHAEVSSKQELYPCGMPALRALKLAHGAIVGVPALTVEDIRERIRSRYPSALPLPDRPALDELLREAGLDLPWDMAGKGGLGCYVTSRRESASISSASDSASRRPTGSRRGEAGVVTPEEADARQFEERLQRGIQEGSFLALLVHSKYYERAAHELCVRFPVRLVDFEGLFLDVLREVTDKARVNWDLVLKTDATPDHGDWDKLLMLVGRAMPIVEESLVTGHRSLVTGHWSLVTGGDASSQGLGTNDQELGTNDQEPRTILLTYAGLLARYGQMDLLSRLSQKAGRRDGIPGLWLLLPGDQQALLDGKPVPLIGAGQRARIPESWLRNVHRGSH